MKKRYLFFILAATISIGAASCRATRVNVNANGDVPPGQMKKITGAKSAKEYAPGQSKVKKNKASKVKTNPNTINYEVK